MAMINKKLKELDDREWNLLIKLMIGVANKSIDLNKSRRYVMDVGANIPKARPRKEA